MRSLDLCPKCKKGRMLCQGTKQLSSGKKRVRRLRCDSCGHRDKEIIDGPARRRPKEKRSSLDLLSDKMGRKCASSISIRQNPPENLISATKGKAMLKSIFQVSKALGIRWIDECRDWIEFGDMPKPLVVGNYLRFRQSDLDIWLVAGCPKSEPPTAEEVDNFWTALLFELKEADSQNERTHNE